MSASLGKLSLSVLHAKRLPRPSQTYNANCPDRGAAWFTIHVSRERQQLNDEDDPEITDVVVRFHAPQHPEHSWPEYVHTFQPIIRTGMRALFEYAYEYGMRRSGRALGFQDGTIDDWITEDIMERGHCGTPRNHYEFGKEWEAINFDDGLFLPEPLPEGGEQEVPTEFMKMCEVVIDRMCTGTCSLLRPPVFRRDKGDDESGEPERLTCGVLLCAANGLGYEALRAPMWRDRGQHLHDPQWASLA